MMSREEFNEIDPLESLLDQQSDADFGEAELREHLDENFEPLVLRNWTAQDFSNIYIRFYPHVLRQAKRYLTNHSQAEEVTQDAFLYLMTSLPEVDSEIGVLKLLKWKVRLLALDVISANSRATLAPIDDQPELSADNPELSLQLERADDAAIVAMALAKLEPRQREALVASLYEEKATSEVASQLQLNENATRQLIFRAKHAFKKALVGEAETRGMSLSQILSVAARRAANEARKNVAGVMGVLVVMGLGLAALLPNFTLTPGPNNIALPESRIPAPVVPTESSSPEPVIEDIAETELSTPAASEEITLPAQAVTAADGGPLSEPVNQSTTAQGLETSAPMQQQLQQTLLTSAQIDTSPFQPWLVDSILEDEYVADFVDLNEAGSAGKSIYTVAVSAGIWADVQFDPESGNPFESVRVGFVAGESQYFSDLILTDFQVQTVGSIDRYVALGSVGAIHDVNGTEFERSRMLGTEFEISIDLNTGSNAVENLAFNRFDTP